MLLALIDGDGTLVVHRMHKGLVPPEEGPGSVDGFGPMHQKKRRQEQHPGQQQQQQPH